MSDQNKINPAWVDAKYRVGFCFGFPRGLRRNWSRKRWLRHKRRLLKKYRAMLGPPPFVSFNQIDWCGEVSFTKNIGASASDIGGDENFCEACFTDAQAHHPTCPKSNEFCGPGGS